MGFERAVERRKCPSGPAAVMPLLAAIRDAEEQLGQLSGLDAESEQLARAKDDFVGTLRQDRRGHR
jgi:hypothetical protein